VKRRQLLRNWGFRCRCTACDSPDDEEDYRRKRLEECFIKINRQEKKIKELGGTGLNHRDSQKYMAIIERGIRLMEIEGMEESDTLGIFYALAVKYGIKLDRQDEAISWAGKAMMIERKCLGEDSKEYQAALELLATAQHASLAVQN
jgi:hypothetical protein